MLLPLTSAFLIGLVLGVHVPYIPATVFLLLLAIAGVLAFVEAQGRVTSRHGVLLYAALLAGIVYWVATAPRSMTAPPQVSTEPIRVSGRIVEPVRHGPQRLVLVLVTEPDQPPAGQKVRVTWRWPDRQLLQGDQVSLQARLHSPSGTVNPGGFNYGTYLMQQGIDAMGSVSGPGAITVLNDPKHTPGPSVWRTVDRWRDRIREAAVATLTGPALGLYLGIIIGEGSYLTPELRDDFMATGTVHILSISGSHLGLIAILVFFIIQTGARTLPAARLLSLSRWIIPTRLAAVLTILPVAFYTVLAGAEVATVRSFIMIALFLLAVWLGREQNLLLPLGLAALVIVLHDPAALLAISFQLSFLSVLAIALVLRWSKPQEGTLPPPGKWWKVRRWLRSYLWISAGITLITLPLGAYYFNQVAWLGLLANLIVVPFAGFVLVPLGLLSAIATLLTGSETLLGGSLNQVLLDVLCWIVAVLARIPWSEWHVASPSLAVILAYYAVLFVAARPVSQPFIRVTAAVATLAILVWWAWSPRFVNATDLRVAFLDVGQGDAAVIELPGGETVLIDGGAAYDTFDLGRSVVAPYLWDRGIHRLDYVIATHPQLDHVGGLVTVLRKFQIREYWDNGMVREESFYTRLDDALQAAKVPRRVAQAGRVLLKTPACQIVILNPPRGGVAVKVTGSASRSKGGSTLNNLAVVARLDCGPQSFLFTADIETSAILRLRQTSDFRGRILKVPHHGAKSSLDEDWVRKAQPEAAVISVGRLNPYGHPAPRVVMNYEASGRPLLRTDQDGAIWITASVGSPGFEIHRAQDLLPQPIVLGRHAFELERVNLSRLGRQWQQAF